MPPRADIAAATPADSPAIMYWGSIRNELKATWLAEMQTGTIRLAHSSRFGRSAMRAGTAASVASRWSRPCAHDRCSSAMRARSARDAVG